MDRYSTLMAVAASPWDGVAWTLAVLAGAAGLGAVVTRESLRHSHGAASLRRNRLAGALLVAAVGLGSAAWGWQQVVHHSRVVDAQAVVQDILAERGLGAARAIDVLAGDGGVTAIAHVGGRRSDDTLWVNALRPSADPHAVYPAGVDPQRPIVVSAP